MPGAQGLVVQYDMATTSELFIHRSGRAGRAGRHGECHTFFDPRPLWCPGNGSPPVTTVGVGEVDGKNRCQERFVLKTGTSSDLFDGTGG